MRIRPILGAFLNAGTILLNANAADIPSLIQKTKPAIVEILTFDQQNKPLMSGTGFFVSSDGLLLTNYHVIAGSSSIIAKTPTGAVYFLKNIVVTSESPDIAELQFFAKDVPYLNLGSSVNTLEGERILVIGNPEGLEGTVSEGIISAFRENRSLIQITAPLSHGSSGSPVIDESGNVIGIATQGYTDGENLNFAIAAETVRNALNKATAKLEAAPNILTASKEHPWENSLGMRFVPVSGTEVLFSIWDTRVRDFQAFVEQTKYDATGGMWSLGKDGWKQGRGTWKDPGFQQGATHPVVGVDWTDSKAFCDWLTKIEQAHGLLPKEMVYRLPTDEEWSLAIGLGYEVGFTPEERNQRIPQVFPWGKEWPPPSGSGNYAGDEFKIGNEPTAWTGIKGYNDGWPRTSPAGTFRPNAFGLYDMGGNVQQWCEDWYDSTEKVVRGSSWANYVYPALLSGNRVHGNPTDRQDSTGFRCVVTRTQPEP
jgi:Sulfatase-modifying factor enzyme 1/Trypsin-like peptidase domain